MITRAQSGASKQNEVFPHSVKNLSIEFEKFSFFAKTKDEKAKLSEVLSSERLVIGGKDLTEGDTISFLVRAI
jgi:hypothetical protein